MTSPDRSASAATKNHNRVAAIMLHTSRYSCYPTSRLAADASLAKSTISHLMHGHTNPLYGTADRVVKCLERELKRSLDFREVFSEDGTYPTPHICALLGCSGCTPEIVYDRDNTEIPAFRFVKAGQWTGDTFEFNSKGEEGRSG